MQKALTLFYVLVILVLCLTTEVNGEQRERRIVGGRTEVKNVKSNKEVQQLGKFSVKAYNREFLGLGLHPSSSSLRGVGLGGSSSTPLDFVEVVEAQRQVVSGLKYYLKVEAMQGEDTKIFDAVVVVKPWAQYKKLLNFDPSPTEIM